MNHKMDLFLALEVYDAAREDLVLILDDDHLRHIVLVWVHQLGVVAVPGHVGPLVLFPRQNLAEDKGLLVAGILEGGSGKLGEVNARTMHLPFSLGNIEVFLEDLVDNLRIGPMVCVDDPMGSCLS